MSSEHAVALILSGCAVYAVGDWWWGRWLRRRHGVPHRPNPYQQAVRESQERRARVEGLGCAVNEVMGEAAGRVSGFYEPTDLTGLPDGRVDPWRRARLEEAARQHTAHAPAPDRDHT
ncbi:hypothetical protein P1P75_11785 [Streptomyces sp. ID05-39B]|uniref:hypothetical protein n=1 Tax=Streptomyces sp. ID05-39B TaxID=3028664 RepID=UPI0029ACA01B|nr:hypothetical protein [Streptomyces sp. ID05-39B]MDX3527104.1 hypothetical protein [Streptomyces sp. ID05-39B]